MIRPRTGRFRLAWTPAFVLGGLLAILGGCMSVEKARFQEAEEPERDRYEVATIGEKTTVGNAEPMPVGGVGLVEGLDNTGGEPPNDENRARLEDSLRKKGIREVKKLLNSTESALVLVSGVIPPGTRKGDPIDLEVRIPRGSPATSLRGGVLREVMLFNYSTTNQLAPGRSGVGGLVLGHPVVLASGPVLVGLGDGQDESRLKVGRIWAGGRSRIDMPFSLVLNSEDQIASMAKLIADRVNQSFLGHTRTTPGVSVAVPQVDAGSATVALNVPAQYRQNLPRFLRVVRLIPLREPGPGGLEGNSPEATPYRKKLQDDLRDPARYVVAALRLEALGSPAIPVMKEVLAESRNPLVRFCTAEALTYLGSTSGVEELGEVVKKHPMLRAYALTAMASLDEAICQEKLQDLLLDASDEEARYGTFRALRMLNERNPFVRGDSVNDSFWLHEIPKGPRPLVHLSTVKRAEVVLFNEPMLQPPFSLPCGYFVVSAVSNDDKCIISLVATGADEPVRKQCSLKVADIIRTMGNMGATYPEVVDLLQQAQQIKSLACNLRIDALPQAISVEELARIGRRGDLSEDSPIKGQIDPRSTPNLFEGSTRTVREASDRQ